MIYRYFATHGFESLRDGWFRAKPLNELNDAHEGMFVLNARKPSTMAVKQMFEEKTPFWTWEAILDGRTIDSNKTRNGLQKAKYAMIAQFMSRYKEIEQSSFIEAQSQLRKSVRVICFTKIAIGSVQEQLMWAHYGGGGSGMRIAFEIDDSELPKHSTLHPVRYTKNKMAIEIEAPSLPGEYERAMVDSKVAASLVTKSLAWEYEHEVRILANVLACKHEDGKDYLHIPSHCVKRVDFGCNYNSDKIAEHHMKLHGQYPHVKFYRTEVHPSEFSFKYRELE